MKATIRDTYNAITRRNLIALALFVIASVVVIDLFGYIVWRRFPIPTLIICVAVIGWKIGRVIGHAGLTSLLNAASFGLGCFGVAIWGAAIVDGRLFREVGHVTWAVQNLMWGWILYHVWGAWVILKNMPPNRLIHVTEGTEAIYAQMTYREARVTEVIERYDEVKKMQLTAT